MNKADIGFIHDTVFVSMTIKRLVLTLVIKYKFRTMGTSIYLRAKRPLLQMTFCHVHETAG